MNSSSSLRKRTHTKPTSYDSPRVFRQHTNFTEFRSSQDQLAPTLLRKIKKHDKGSRLLTQQSQTRRQSSIKEGQACDKIRLLCKLRSICNEYERTQMISEGICKQVYQLLEMLVGEESNYGADMARFFQILKRMMFCENNTLLFNLKEFSEGEKKPYNCMVMNVLDQKYRELLQKERDIEAQIAEMNDRIELIDREYREKMGIMLMQHENSTTSLKIECQTEINQCHLKIALMRENLQMYERKFRTMAMTGPTRPKDKNKAISKKQIDYLRSSDHIEE